MLLARIDLSENPKIKKESLEDLFEVLLERSAQTLRELSLEKCNLSSELDELNFSGREVERALPRLQRLNLDRNPGISERGWALILRLVSR